MHVFGPNELLEDVLKQDLCIGCGACVDLCPYFKNYNGKTASLFPCDLTKGRCYAYCPKAEVDIDELSKQIWGIPFDGSPLGNYQEVMAARAGENMVKGSFQGGGTVSSLIAFALKHKHIDAAALTDSEGLKPVSRLVTAWEEVVGCATSKFMASPTLSAVNTGVREGYTRLGVVGTPCQMMAVAQLRGNPMAKEDFADPIALTIGLFCNWSLDARQLTAMLADKLDVSGIRGMDIPPPPANIMIVETQDRRLEIPLSEVKPLIPQTCFICLDMTAEWCDVSVGMFEGRPGWNTLIVRSESGAELVRLARDKGFLETEEMPRQNLNRLAKAAADKKERSLRTLIRRGLINNEAGKRSSVKIAPEIVKKILG
jgi:coenzyme F420 hydrogenase subunit beta